MNALKKIDHWIENIVTGALFVSVLLMIICSMSIIVLRWFDQSLLWMEPLVRHLVFLSAFLGGALATGKGTHIGIDILGKFFESKKMWTAHLWVNRIINIASTIVLYVFVSLSIDFVKMESEFGREIFLGIHSKYLVSIIPIGFAIIGIRFLLRLILSFEPREQGAH